MVHRFRHPATLWLLALLLGLPTGASAAPVVLNEYNSVDATGYLHGGDATLDSVGGAAQDPFFGRVAGNGGDWFELVVLAENLDIRGWKLELDASGSPPTTLVFSNDPLWSQLRAGTIITVAEDVADDASYDPDNGDWWIHVQANATSGTGTFISATDFDVSAADWTLTIRDAADGSIFGPAGEGVAPASGVDGDGVVALWEDPSAQLLPASPSYGYGYASSFGAPNRYADGTLIQSLEPLRQGLVWPDRDGDGISEDGDRSGFVGDTPCTGGAAAGCDDNCGFQPNALQSDPDGVVGGGPDGVGTACQCGDFDSDGAIGSSDVTMLRSFLIDLSGAPPSQAFLDHCSVIGAAADCDVRDLTVLRRAVEPAIGLPPGVAQVCRVAMQLVGNQPPVISSTPINAAVESFSYTYDVDAADPDLSDSVSYALETAPPGMTIDAGTGVISWTPGPAELGSHLVTVVASDTAGLTDRQSFPVEVFTATATALYRINAGGPDYTDSLGNPWVADTGFNTGATYSVSSGQAIAGTADPTLYQTERYDPSSAPDLVYSLPVAAGEYRVRLHFANIYSGTSTVGSRVFDVAIEGTTVLDDFDIIAAVGNLAATVQEFDVTVSDASVEIAFSRVLENPKISAIEVLQLTPPSTVTASPGLIEWGHIAVGEAGGTRFITLENTGSQVAFVDRLDFVLQQGVGHDFHVTIAGTTYTGGDQTVGFDIALALAPGESVVLPADFLPTEEFDNLVSLEFSGNFPATGVTLSGSGGQDTGDPFLHVVINFPTPIVDYDGDGSESVDLEGSFSHTHEFGHQLVGFEWAEGGVPFASQADVTHSFALGSHDVSLTITDDNSPPRVLTDSKTLIVSPTNAITGALAFHYAAGASTPTDLLTNIPADPDYAQQIPGLYLDTAPIGADVMVRLVSGVDLPVTDSYAFQLTGGSGQRLLVDDAEVTGPVTLTAGLHTLDARFALDTTNQLPVAVQMAQGGGTFQPIPAQQLTHDLTSVAPVINNLNPTTGTELGGNLVVIQGLGFFLSSEVVVHWGATDLSGPDLQLISPEEIRLAAPPGSGSVAVSVSTPRGTSGSFTFTYQEGGPLPIDFTLRDLATGISSPTSIEMGPDGRLYVGTVGGEIYALTLDDAYNVTDSQLILPVSTGTNENVLGIAFNPFDPPDPVRIYVSHSLLFANGGACFTGFSPYSGQISVLEGPDFDTLIPLVTGLPVSNHDHGVNGIAFDSNGDLYVLNGGNTNAGVRDCLIGDLPESPLSAAVLKAAIAEPGFNGAITYVESASGLPNDDQVDGDIVDVAPGSDVTVYAPGLRNPFDLVFTTRELLFATDNGPNGSFGAASTGPNTETTGPTAPDELNLIEFERYYGHPNRNRGVDDPRQYVYHGDTEPSLPGVFTQTLSTYTSSTNGLFEYRANTFNGAMRGDLIAQRLNGVTYRTTMTPDGRSVASQTTLPVSLNSLGITDGPGGVILGADYDGSKVVIAEPNETVTGLRVYDIFPWRAPASGGHPFTLGGAGFGGLGDTTVTIGGLPAVLTAVSSNRIHGTIPANPGFNKDLLDVEVSVSGQSVTLTKAFRYLGAPGSEPWGWRRGPDLPVALGETGAGVIGGKLYVVGEGDPATLAFDLANETWSSPSDLAVRPFPGHHSPAEVLNGKLYLFGGIGDGADGKVQIYDSASDTWTLGTDMPWAAGSSVSAVIGGQAYVCGGIVSGSTQTTCQRYDPIADSWTPLADMVDGRNHAPSATDGAKLYVFGGRGPGSGNANQVANGFSDVQIYDPVTDTWESSNDPGSTIAPLPQARGGGGTAVFFDGEFYVLGGETLDGPGATPTRTYDRVDVYNPVTNTWRVVAPMPTGMHGIYPVVYGGQIYLPGGGTSAGYSISQNLLIYGIH